ncbi:Phosphate-repressible phosphate permease pho-4 [Smittium culicis]|uniref:Phosphate transporter n=1 Tax=Smittium culicis TaxID=133412 RepID=A0A1R1YFS1_9FUNG|nr:Phosphate-repressible phosphate permease pho-4 [Smittium culicis]
MQPHEYTYIYVLALIFSFADAYGIGANDVANSFATSVSSGTLTLGQATCIAIVTEFCGAFFLGSGTSATISGGIISTSLFTKQPEILMLGMTTSVFASATWVIFATSRGWPVSSTHSITGAIVGMGIASYGSHTVKWGYNGIAKIVTSWFVSPLIAAVVSSIIYMVTKYVVLESKNSFKRGLMAIPVYIFVTVWVCLSFIISKGIPGTKAVKISFKEIVGISAAAALGVSIITYFTYAQWLRRKIIGREDLKWYHAFFTPFIGKRPVIPELSDEEIEAAVAKESKEKQNDVQPDINEMNLIQKVKHFILRGVKQDVRNIGNPRLASIHARAKKYDNDTEYLFQFVQVLTACAASFAHGSNDVANAVGPIAAVASVWSTGTVPGDKSVVKSWNLAFCAVGIDFGLATYGYHIMRTLGNNITYTTPSRGFAAELGTALTIVTASKLGLPVSTTHCITGAMVGVGLCNGDMKAINWKMFAICFLSWVLTLPAAGLISGLLFALVAHAPHLN